MPTIDVQVHAYERNHPGRPWIGHLHGPPSANGEEMVAAMDRSRRCGDYRLHFQSLPLRCQLRPRGPCRLSGAVSRGEADRPGRSRDRRHRCGLGEDKRLVGIRIMLRDEALSDPKDPRLNHAFAVAGRHGLPVNFLCWGRLDDGTELIRRNPDTVIVIDHLGLLQPSEPPPLAEPWADLPKLLALAAYPNAGSRSAAPARCRARRSHTTTSGIRC